MRGKYYKPKGLAMLHTIDWLVARSEVWNQWKEYAESYCMTKDDLEIREGRVIGFKWQAPFDDEDAKALSVDHLPRLPDEYALGRMLDVERAQAVTTTGKGVLVVVFDEKGLEGHEELTDEELAKDYNIHVRAKECPHCGLMLSFDEKKCHRCGLEVNV